MPIRNIEIRLSHEVAKIVGKFEDVTSCLEELYLKHLGKVKFQSFTYIDLYLSSKKIDKKIEIVLNQLIYHRHFDFDTYYSKSKDARKEYLTIWMHKCLIELCKIYDVEATPFDEAFKIAKSQNYEFNYYFKNKLFRSPDRLYYAGLFHINDLSNYEIYEVLFDKNKKEIKRRICFKDNMPLFRIREFKWTKNSKAFYYKFKGPEKLFNVEISDLLDGLSYQLPETTSEFFKIR